MPPALPLHYSPPGAGRTKAFLSSRFSRWHAWVAVVLWLVFSGLTLLIVLNGLDHATDKRKTVALTTAGTVLGPITGAISRDFQGCCLRASLDLMPYCLAGLLTGLAVQLVVPPRGAMTGMVRVVAWVAGLLAWFGGGMVSFAHALS
jgi:hypothetical protein